jgi:hypothetical protein
VGHARDAVDEGHLRHGAVVAQVAGAGADDLESML